MISWADVGICHLETPVAPPGEAISTYPQYGVPADIAPSLAAVGYDRCSTASNHTMDRGVAGIDATVAALAAAGIAQSGMARSAEEAVPPLFTVHGITFAHLSFTYGFNGASLPAGQPWRSNLLSADAVIAQAREARARGAQVVIASLHWGNEGSNVITAEQRSIAEQVTASGQVDVIVGHHVHVIQPIEQVNGRWVVYGMGNILSNLPTAAGRVWPASTQDGMIVTLSFTRQLDGSVGVSRPMVVPTWVDKNARWLIRPVQQDLVDQDVPLATRQQLAVSLARTTAVVGDFLAPSP
jgi:poly-gamma-glutamate capsule biosynthesis protein CapA/YwtB (metallophosphatase superfamily)